MQTQLQFEEIEIWKDIPGWEGYYQVSSFGRVKSLSRIVLVKASNGSFLKKETILKLTLGNRGYKTVLLQKDGYVDRWLVHRLVASAFIPNPLFLEFVNHKDLDKLNNYISNLEWCTQADNNRHAFRNGALKAPPEYWKIKNPDAPHFNSRGINRISIDGKEIKRFNSLTDAVNELKVNGKPKACTAGICSGAKNKERIAYGYHWQYD